MKEIARRMQSIRDKREASERKERRKELSINKSVSQWKISTQEAIARGRSRERIDSPARRPPRSIAVRMLDANEMPPGSFVDPQAAHSLLVRDSKHTGIGPAWVASATESLSVSKAASPSVFRRNAHALRAASGDFRLELHDDAEEAKTLRQALQARSARVRSRAEEQAGYWPPTWWESQVDKDGLLASLASEENEHPHLPPGQKSDSEETEAMMQETVVLPAHHSAK